MLSNYPVEEIWKPIEGYENYQVSSWGRIKNSHGRILKPYHTSKGYLHINLYRDSKVKGFMVHRLVAKAFLPNPNNYPEINHIDENKKNNYVGNLEWCTTRYNVRYNWATKVDIYTDKGDFVETMETLGDVAEKYTVPVNAVYRYCRVTIPYKGFIFKLHNPEKSRDLSIKEKRRVARLAHKSNEARYIPLLEYTLDGNFVTTWKNSKEAEKAYGINAANIHKCKNGEIKTISGRIFLKEGDSIENRLLEISNRKRKSKTELKYA